jgi:uncharacterized protein with PIN domain
MSDAQPVRFVCPSCDTVFWKGGHVRNTLRKLAEVPGIGPPTASEF